MKTKDQAYYLTNHPELLLSALDILCADYIGSGSSRDVYHYGVDTKFVVKIEQHPGGDRNSAEFKIWHHVKGTKHEKWFAECWWISDDNRIMIQCRTRPLTTRRPEKIPTYFTDVKESNWGTIGGQFVCHDYSETLPLLLERGISRSPGMKTWNPWNE